MNRPHHHMDIDWFRNGGMPPFGHPYYEPPLPDPYIYRPTSDCYDYGCGRLNRNF